MPVMLISDIENLVWKHETTESGFYYKRPPSKIQRDLAAKHTIRGELQASLYLEELISWSITGWFGFVNTEGETIEYKPEYLERVPDGYKAQFVEAMYRLYPEVVELGN